MSGKPDPNYGRGTVYGETKRTLEPRGSMQEDGILGIGARMSTNAHVEEPPGEQIEVDGDSHLSDVANGMG